MALQSDRKWSTSATQTRFFVAKGGFLGRSGNEGRISSHVHSCRKRMNKLKMNSNTRDSIECSRSVQFKFKEAPNDVRAFHQSEQRLECQRPIKTVVLSRFDSHGKARQLFVSQNSRLLQKTKQNKAIYNLKVSVIVFFP